MYTKNTKIVCTLGPSSDSVKEIEAIAHAGMNVARLNFSHGTHKNHAQLIKNIHKVEKNTGLTIGILQDLQGPKVRIGDMPKEGIKIHTGKTFTLTIKEVTGFIDKKDEPIIPIAYKNITKDVKKGDTILINDGLIEAKILHVRKTQLECKVKTGGTLHKGNGINFPTASISKAIITKKDKEDLKFGLKNGIDYVALSFVKSRKDIKDLKKLMGKVENPPQIIAKIERHEAIKNLKGIIIEADGVMVARGDLGADIRPEQVPVIQKRIIALANKYGKPVITATQVLYSMVTKSKATRAEISDAANAIFDHSDAIMLSNETAVGKYPVRSTTTLTRVASTVEKEMNKHEELLEKFSNSQLYMTPINATCLNACELALDTRSSFLVAYTDEGFTAKLIAKFRTAIPIITVCSNKKVARQLALVWGLNKVLVSPKIKKSKNKISEITKLLIKEKLVKKGQKIVIVCNANRKERLISTYKV
jgi:pyruvate kinase